MILDGKQRHNLLHIASLCRSISEKGGTHPIPIHPYSDLLERCALLDAYTHPSLKIHPNSNDGMCVGFGMQGEKRIPIVVSLRHSSVEEGTSLTCGSDLYK